MNTSETKKTKSKKGWIIAAIGLVIVIGIYFTFKWEIYVRYYNLVNNHFSYYDKIYVKDEMMKPHSYIPIWRVICPIDKNSLEKPYVIECGKIIIIDSLTKHKSAYLGNYISHQILNVKASNIMVFTNFYAFKPNEDALENNGFYESIDMPKGFVWQDSNLYIFATDITGHETYIDK